MKLLKKRITSLVVAFLLVMTMVPVTVVEAAVEVPKSIVVYQSSISEGSGINIPVYGLTSKQSVSKSSVKSSNKAVATPRFIYTSTNSNKTEYYNGDKPYSSNSKFTNINFQSKKAGTSTISMKIGNKTYKTKLTVKKYENPIKSISFFGIKNGKSTNLAGKLKKSSEVQVKLPATKKKQTIKVTAASGWKIRNIGFTNQQTSAYYNYSTYSHPVSSASLYVGTVTKGKKYSISVELVNSNGGSIYVSYDIN